MWADDEDEPHFIAYCTHVDASGRRTLLPIDVRLVKDKISPFYGVIYLQQGGRLMAWEDGALVDEPGLIIRVTLESTDVTACTGRTADPATSWCLAPAEVTYTDTSALQRTLRILRCLRRPGRILRKCWRHAAGRTIFTSCWPCARRSAISGRRQRSATPTKMQSSSLPFPVPAWSPIWPSCCCWSRWPRRRLRATQLRIHAEAVERHDQRGRMRLKAAGGDSSGGDESGSGGDTSGGSRQSASAASSVARLGNWSAGCRCHAPPPVRACPRPRSPAAPHPRRPAHPDLTEPPPARGRPLTARWSPFARQAARSTTRS